MSKAYSTRETSDAQKQVSLHICSNTAVGETPFTPYWQDRVESLRQEAVPFQVIHTATPPTILLNVERHPRLPTLLNPRSDTFELWPTWCTFLTEDLQLSDTFLFLSVNSRESYWLILRFEHSRHLTFLERIGEAEQMILSVEPEKPHCLVPFYDPELPLHLETIRCVQKSGECQGDL